jgi:hypothetical protein
MTELSQSQPLDQQVNLESLGPNPDAEKLDSDLNEYQLRLELESGYKIRFDHLEGGDDVDPTWRAQ